MSWMYRQTGPEPPFHDRAWKRAELASLDTRWDRLSPEARRAFADDIRVAASAGTHPPRTPAARFPSAVLDELQAAGFIETIKIGGKDQIVVPAALIGFAARLRALKRYALLHKGDRDDVTRYVNHVFDRYRLYNALGDVLQKATGRGPFELDEDPSQILATRGRWPTWVADYLNDPLARPILAAVEAAGGVLPIGDLAARLPDQPAVNVRATLDRLVNHLALVEDVDKNTGRLLVGFLPEVREDMKRLRQRPPRQPLVPRTPAQLAPDSGIEIPDLRAFLLELASQPARLRTDHTLYQKEMDRFAPALPALPDWLMSPTAASGRVEYALSRARSLKLVRDVTGSGNTLLLELSQAGQKWLTSGVNAQYAAVYRDLREPPQDTWYGHDDSRFLGSYTTSVPAAGDAASRWYKPEQRRHLRAALHQALLQLPVGQFFDVEEVTRNLSRGEGNPLYLGLGKDQVVVRESSRMVLPLEEVIEDKGAALLRDFFSRRLAPLGAVQLGLDEKKRYLAARLPRLDLYFGGEVEEAAEVAEQSRVIVQPDFSVVLIGLNPAPAAELMPFCDRAQGSMASGSMTLRISRESVLRGLAAGLTVQEVIGRLERLSSTPVPANVRTQVESWGGWMRKVKARPVVLLSCPDEETAARVLGALGKKAERAGATAVAVDPGVLTPAVRQKLRQNGLVVEGSFAEKKRR